MSIGSYFDSTDAIAESESGSVVVYFLSHITWAQNKRFKNVTSPHLNHVTTTTSMWSLQLACVPHLSITVKMQTLRYKAPTTSLNLLIASCYMKRLSRPVEAMQNLSPLNTKQGTLRKNQKDLIETALLSVLLYLKLKLEGSILMGPISEK